MSKPTAAIAHVFMKTPNVKKTVKFYLSLGLRKVWESPQMGIVELRGGTHILFFKNKVKFAKPPRATFDLMVDEVKVFHKDLKKEKYRVSKILSDKRSGHELFTVTDPDGRVITIYSSHTEGREV